MDLNVAVPPANELFDDNDMVFPILMGRENLKILASPGSESSGVSSLDAEEAKKLANEQLPTSSSPTMASEPSSAVQTESESSDGGSDGDDDKPIEQSSSESVQSTDESEQQSNTSDDEDKDDVSVCKEHSDENAAESDDHDNELVSNAVAQDDDDKASQQIDLDEIRYKNLKIFYEGRDILDFTANVANKSWNVKYAHLPEQNYQMYIQNRSQYNRLAPGYESPEHYALNACGRCAFNFPVMVDIPDEADQTATNACKSSVNDLLTQTVASIVSALAQKLPAAQPMAQPSMHTPTGQSMNNLNNFMLNNNATQSSAQSYAYQNRNQFANNANAIAAAAAAAAANNHSSFKPNNNNNSNNNAFYGNNMVLNALVNQIGNNINNSSAFNSNFINAINGTNNTNNTIANQLNQLNQLSNAALANLMNQNQRQQLYGMCRQNINKSGINFNANSHKQMPTYSHF